MLPSHEQLKELLIMVFSPIISGGTLIRSITDDIDSYSHVIAADGGYLSAEIKIKANLDIADEWLSEGLGRHIEVKGVMGEEAWIGFVNTISVNFGNYTISRGPLTDVCNRCLVLYVPIIDPNADPPVTGTQTETIIAEDIDSQKKYGIWEQAISGGTLLDDEAESLRDVYLNENKNPATSHSPTIFDEGGSDVIITLSCRGYIDWLNNYIYENRVAPISTTADDKIKSVLLADPNVVVSTDVRLIEFNGILVPSWEDQNRSASTVINEIVSAGDIIGNRWLFGVYEGRQAVYKAIPTEVEYYHYIGAENQRIVNIGYGEIPLYSVRPGKFAMIKDVVIGKLTNYSQLRIDERVVFIEQITYTAPAKIEMQGKKVGTYSQLLARLGLFGG
jgi:hypothetical protein